MRPSQRPGGAPRAPAGRPPPRRGLPELRRVLADHGIDEAFWAEVPKSRRAADQVRRALDEGPHAVLAWGGDGLVRRCIGVLAGSVARLAVIPAATAYLFASNLGIPRDDVEVEPGALKLRVARSDRTAQPA